MAAINARELTAIVNVDVSGALTGLKALQREAKEATKALRELEVAKYQTSSANEPQELERRIAAAVKRVER